MRACWSGLLIIASVGCSARFVEFTATPDGGTLASAGDVPTLDTQGSSDDLDNTIVYAHSDTTLYAVDPRTNAFSTVGTFTFPSGDTNSHTMTDLAVDASGNVVCTSANALWQVNPNTALCTLMTTLPSGHSFVGLTYVPVGVLDPAQEVLVGGATDGSYWQININTGAVTQLGQFQDGWQLSGDIVSIAGGQTWATVRRSSDSDDSLATLDPTSGALTILGDTHHESIFGLAYWRTTLYGFTHDGEFLTINSETGEAHVVSTPVMQFSGAGVTTLAPTAPP